MAYLGIDYYTLPRAHPAIADAPGPAAHPPTPRLSRWTPVRRPAGPWPTGDHPVSPRHPDER